MIYTTNTIENLNKNIRKITKTKGAFTNTQSLSKIIYMCLKNIQEDYDSRVVHNWPQILNQLTILFPDRLCDIKWLLSSDLKDNLKMSFSKNRYTTFVKINVLFEQEEI